MQGAGGPRSPIAASRSRATKSILSPPMQFMGGESERGGAGRAQAPLGCRNVLLDDVFGQPGVESGGKKCYNSMSRKQMCRFTRSSEPRSPSVSRLPPILLVLSLASALPAWAVEPATSLRGSPSSMVRQNQVARTQDYSFLRTHAEVRRMARNGYLVRLEGNEHYRLANVGYPYARPVVRSEEHTSELQSLAY